VEVTTSKLASSNARFSASPTRKSMSRNSPLRGLDQHGAKSTPTTSAPARAAGPRARRSRTRPPASAALRRPDRGDDRVVDVGDRLRDLLERRVAPHERLTLLQLLKCHLTSFSDDAGVWRLME
jgi:hypothetical protein